MAKCRHCGWDWSARVVEPRACPHCKRYGWKAVVAGYEMAKDGFKEPRKADKIVLAEAHYSPLQPRMAEHGSGTAVLEIVEDAVRLKSEASSGRGSGGRGDKRIGISDGPEDSG